MPSDENIHIGALREFLARPGFDQRRKRFRPRALASFEAIYYLRHS